MRCTEIKPNRLGLTEKELAVLGEYRDMDYIKTEAALCAWEYLLDVYSTREAGFEALNGTGQARMCCVSLGYAIHVGFCVASVDDRLDGVAYDWEFVPWFMETCVIWNTADASLYGEPLLKDNWIDLCRRCFEPEPSDEDLLREAVKIFNLIPNQHGSYDLAAKIDRRLKA